MNKTAKIFAFTLAEVLITLGIIGVVAAMTLPSLVQKYQEKARVSQLKKTYSSLQQAYLRATVEYGTIDNWGLTTTNNVSEDAEHYDYTGPELVANRICKYVQHKKICSANEPECLGISQTLSIKGTPIFTAKDRLAPGCVLTDGSVFLVGWTQSSPSDNNYCDFMIVVPHKNKDVVRGKDAFYFSMQKNKIVPQGYNQTTMTSCYHDGHDCAAWVILNENMDYLHCNDLSWNGKKKCK